jgi:hypothetical protein
MSQEIITKVEGDVAPLTARAMEMAKVVDAKTEADAVEFLVQIKTVAKKVDAERSFLVKPLNDHVKEINGKFKPYLTALEDAETMVKKGMTEYRQSAEFKALEDARLSLEQEAHLLVKEGDAVGLQAVADAHKEASALAPKSVQSDSGKAHFRTIKKFEITGQIPIEYMMPDEKKIKAAIEAGANIPGVKVWEEQVPVIR